MMDLSQVGAGSQLLDRKFPNGFKHAVSRYIQLRGLIEYTHEAVVDE